MISDDERGQYAARQYQSLRDEMAQARQSQQAILQWSQAVSATLFAAALVAGTGHSSHYVVAAQFVLGVILPAVLLGGALTWSGEMIRLTRIGIFLRSFERYTWDEKAPDLAAGTSLFIWQNFAWSPPEQFALARFHGKQNTGYAGIGIYFGVMYTGSLIVFGIISPFPLNIVVPLLLVGLGLVVMVTTAAQLFRLNAKSPVITEDDLKKWLITLNAGGGQPSKGMLSRFRL